MLLFSILRGLWLLFNSCFPGHWLIKASEWNSLDKHFWVIMLEEKEQSCIILYLACYLTVLNPMITVIWIVKFYRSSVCLTAQELLPIWAFQHDSVWSVPWVRENGALDCLLMINVLSRRDVVCAMLLTDRGASFFSTPVSLHWWLCFPWAPP